MPAYFGQSGYDPRQAVPDFRVQDFVTAIFPTSGPGVDVGPFRDPSLPALSAAFQPAACQAAFGVDALARCQSITNLYPFIQAPLFVLEHQFDALTISLLLGVEYEGPDSAADLPLLGARLSYIKRAGSAARESQSQIIRGNTCFNKVIPDGFFSPSCFMHTENLGVSSTPVQINGEASGEVLGDWFHQRNTKPHRLAAPVTHGLPTGNTGTCFGVGTCGTVMNNFPLGLLCANPQHTDTLGGACIVGELVARCQARSASVPAPQSLISVTSAECKTAKKAAKKSSKGKKSSCPKGKGKGMGMGMGKNRRSVPFFNGHVVTLSPYLLLAVSALTIVAAVVAAAIRLRKTATQPVQYTTV